MNLKQLLSALLVTFVYNAFSQETFPRNDVKDLRTKAYAFTNATIYIDYKTKILSVILSQGKIDIKSIKYIDLRFKEPIIGKK